MSHHGNIYRDGKVHVRLEMCDTCVFRPGNLMRLKAGALRDVIDGNLAGDAALPCHQTLAEYPGGGKEAVCRGFFERHQTTPLRLAEAMGVIEWV